jgi:hypothetical protein
MTKRMTEEVKAARKRLSKTAHASGMSLETLLKRATNYVAHERDEQDKEARKGLRDNARRAGEIAKHTSTYDPQRKSAGRKGR